MTYTLPSSSLNEDEKISKLQDVLGRYLNFSILGQNRWKEKPIAMHKC